MYLDHFSDFDQNSWEINAANGTGIDIENTNAYLVIRNCIVEKGYLIGIYLDNATNVNVIDNILSNNGIGIHLSPPNNNNIIGTNGIYLIGANNTTIFGNNCSNNVIGIGLEFESTDNLIWGNNFFNNSELQAVCSNDSLANQWYCNQTGNYYGDYLTQNPFATSDGRIWNTPYQIDGSVQDLYPLVNQATINLTTFAVIPYLSPPITIPLPYLYLSLSIALVLVIAVALIVWQRRWWKKNLAIVA